MSFFSIHAPCQSKSTSCTYVPAFKLKTMFNALIHFKCLFKCSIHICNIKTGSFLPKHSELIASHYLTFLLYASIENLTI